MAAQYRAYPRAWHPNPLGLSGPDARARKRQFPVRAVPRRGQALERNSTPSRRLAGTTAGLGQATSGGRNGRARGLPSRSGRDSGAGRRQGSVSRHVRAPAARAGDRLSVEPRTASAQSDEGCLSGREPPIPPHVRSAARGVRAPSRGWPSFSRRRGSRVRRDSAAADEHRARRQFVNRTGSRRSAKWMIASRRPRGRMPPSPGQRRAPLRTRAPRRDSRRCSAR